MSDSKTAVEVYEAQIAALRMENEQLRRSAQAFGGLADRLNRALQAAKATSSAVDPPVPTLRHARGGKRDPHVFRPNDVSSMIAPVRGRPDAPWPSGM